MKSRKKKNVPGWFPFTLVATSVIMILSGARAKWKLTNEEPKSPPPEPGVKGTPYRLYWS